MRLAALATLLIFLAAPARLAQSAGALRVAGVSPAGAAPSQIVELRVEGFDERLITPPPGGELRVLLTQDGATHEARARTASPVSVRTSARPGGGGPPDPASAEMRHYQGVTFVVPRALHAGGAEVAVSYKGRRSAPARLNVLERPLRPVVGGASVITIAPSNLPAPSRAGAPADRAALGLRLERGAKGVELHVRPLSDPDDAEAGVVVRFRQGGAFYDANARVVHRPGGREDFGNGGFRLMPARDVLEVDVPDVLAPGEAELEISLRAAGQTGEAALVTVTVTDAARAYESPKEAAPRLLAVTPRRVGAGQALMISVDRRRALDPDPSKTSVVFQTPDGAWSFKVKPEMNSAVRNPLTPPDAPVLLIVRAPKQMTGAVQLRLLNPARADYEGAASEPAQVEIVSEALAPEQLSAGEASEAELSQLRQLAAARGADPRARPGFDPAARYLSVRARGLDPNPRFLRVRVEQEGRAAVTLGPEHFALFTADSAIVRLPDGFGAGAARLSVENRGAAGYSAPAVATFELSPRR